MCEELKGRVVSVQTLPKKENAEAVVAVALSTRQADMALPESVINRDRSRRAWR